MFFFFFNLSVACLSCYRYQSCACRKALNKTTYWFFFVLVWVIIRNRLLISLQCTVVKSICMKCFTRASKEISQDFVLLWHIWPIGQLGLCSRKVSSRWLFLASSSVYSVPGHMVEVGDFICAHEIYGILKCSVAGIFCGIYTRLRL